MIDALIQGRVYDIPKQGQGKNGPSSGFLVGFPV